MSIVTDTSSGADPKGYVLVSGASRGIGRGIALALARAGFDLVLWGRVRADLGDTAVAARARGAEVICAGVDVSDPDSVSTAGAESVARLHSLRGVVVNAGGATWSPIARTATTEWRNTLATNLDGAFYTIRAGLPLLSNNPWAQLVGISSDSASFSFPTRGAYCAAKAGLASLLETARREHRGAGLRVSALALSRVDTHFRGKQPGDRPEAMSISEAAALVANVFALPRRIEIRELKASSITTTFGPYPEHQADATRCTIDG
ncbi:SDR family NAD(P)-dependent oxidoreductase [Nocardia suismassiliense]|uniref:SDR family NAD(P)-dependent oxidoreductase n=1 Tax=Nocardia suismassiliense TaxID=2077092 RepID=UPI00131EFCE0|nr:SDR family oxidoreductase [Nocardia suismassiliense]